MNRQMNDTQIGVTRGETGRLYGLTGRMLRYVEDNDLIRRGDHVVVAVSGGADSICLLCCLAEIKDRLGATVSALHVEHGIRGDESIRDAEFTENFCRELGIEFAQRSIPEGELKAAQGLSLEEAARLRRYEFLEEERLRFSGMANEGSPHGPFRSLIAVAHHRDDQAETVLLNIFRGSGIEGIRGMLPKRDMIIRPLLFAKRTEIEDYLSARGICWCTDSTNLEYKQTRNRIRNHILPYIENEINPQAAEHIAALAEDAGEVAAYLEEAAAGWLERAAACCGGSVDQTAYNAGFLELAISEISRSPSLIVRMGMRRAMELLSGSRKDIGRVHMVALAELAGKKVGSRIDLPYGITAERGYKTITLVSKRSMGPQGIGASPETGAASDVVDEVRSISGRMKLRVFQNQKCHEQLIPKKKYTKWFDYDKMNNKPEIRFRMTGDKISLKGVGTKTVKSLMIDLRIPAKERGHIPILADDKAVIWVVGYRVNDDYLVTEKTKRILEAVYEPTGMHDTDAEKTPDNRSR